MAKYPGEQYTYYSFDSIPEGKTNLYPIKYLNSIPSQGLTLKVNAPIMLHRNLYPVNRLCNGTRFICQQFQSQIIDTEIITGDHQAQATDDFHENNDLSDYGLMRFTFNNPVEGDFENCPNDGKTLCKWEGETELESDNYVITDEDLGTSASRGHWIMLREKNAKQKLILCGRKVSII
ncbi:14943_t:CDS:2 [Entrophospora sp. SA101]|nr:14943_t:CDS:2 [Entrophospora sp. SA101]